MSSSSFDNIELSDARPRGSNCPEPCAVCGDSSSGYHYDVPSCNGCKTFFRRTIIANRKFECHRDGKCQFDKDVRCACRACRFQRCVAVGMNPKAIQFTPTAVGLGKKRKLVKTESISDASSFSEQQITQMPPQASPVEPNDTLDDALIERLLDIERKCEYLRTSDFPLGRSLLDQLTRPCALDDVVEKYATRCTWKEEKNTIEKFKFWLRHDLTILIEYAKSFDSFRYLSLIDKCALLQQVSMVCCVVVTHWDSARKGHDVIVLPCGFTPSKDITCCGRARARITNSRLMQAFKRHDFDRTEYALLKAILFFHTDCWELSKEGKEQVGAERQKYLRALFKYSCAKYGPAGPGKYGMSLALLPTMHDSAEQHKDRMRVGEILRQKDIDPFFQEMILGKKITI
uniref:Uncharacterized protein n=1 Tax=Plectus sambesii TaxID=2011161 RepID=A0A914WFS5_9BILA